MAALRLLQSGRLFSGIRLTRHQEFRRSYTIARQCQMEDLMDEMLEIADDSSSDYVEKTGADGKVTRVFNK